MQAVDHQNGRTATPSGLHQLLADVAEDDVLDGVDDHGVTDRPAREIRLGAVRPDGDVRRSVGVQGYALDDLLRLRLDHGAEELVGARVRGVDAI